MGGNAELFILDLETGAKLAEIDTGAGGDTGLSSATPVDVDGDRITDYIYAGDLMGNLWKFDVTSSSASNWQMAFSGAPLYTACSADPCTLANRQPITARPEVGINLSAGYFVYFGTGRYFANGDNGVGTGANTMYAIRDKNEKGTASPAPPAAGCAITDGEEIVSQGGFYTLTVAIADAATYTLTAVPDGPQMEDEKCGTLGLTNTGVRSITGDGDLEHCW